MQITIKQLKKIFGNVEDDFLNQFVFILNHYSHLFNISKPMDYVRFLAQVKHELGFKRNGKPRLKENLNYKAKQLKRFSKRFRNNPNLLNKAMSLSGKEKQKFIAMEWYGKGKKARDLGNKQPIDGWRYRGFGLFQITGRSNHVRVWKVVENKLNIKVFDENGEVLPSLLNSYFGAIITAMAFWYITKMYKCNSSMCVINKINRGLPKKEKLERIETAKRIMKILKV